MSFFYNIFFHIIHMVNTDVKTKKITIKPDAFIHNGYTRTRKQRIFNKNNTAIPAVNATQIQKKLVKRIRELRTNELKQAPISPIAPITPIAPIAPIAPISSQVTQTTPFSDETADSLSYINNLKKQQQMHRQKQRLAARTLKHKESQPSTQELFVDTSLPPELSEFSSSIDIPTNTNDVKLNYTSLNPPPYGCLKGGDKPSYKNWKAGNETRRNLPSTNNRQMSTQMSTHDPNVLSREQRLAQIKQKIKYLESTTPGTSSNNEKPIPIQPIDSSTNELTHISAPIEDILKEHTNKQQEIIDKNKRTFKHTTKRKFTLGKLTNLKQISVLIKNNKTRKDVINTQKQLKTTDIKDVRKYLKQHGLLKNGSTCPNNILRKTFESSLLAGEITNTNKDALIHNYLDTSQ